MEGGGELRVELLQRFGAEEGGGLLHGVLEKVAHEAAPRDGVARGVVREVAGAVEFNGVALGADIVGGGVHGLIVLGEAEAAHGVEVF